MQTTSVKLYAFSYRELKTYGLALLFVLGNLVLPQLFHLMPQGGVTWLPIYFFTLVAAYKYGWKVGLLTAVLSPMANALLFGMPAFSVLPAILIKSVLLATAAGFAASHYKKTTFLMFVAVVLFYQFVGFFGEWALKGDFLLASQDFRIGIPGMLLQVIGGYFCINYLIRK